MRLIGIILIIMVIALYLLWIRFTKNQSGVSAREKEGVQIFDILVKGGYSPSVIKAKVNQPLRINFKREENSECSRFVVFGDFKIRRELPENKITVIEFTPNKKGEFTFTCDMGMYQGRLMVK